MSCSLTVERFWPAVHDASPNGIIVVDVSGKIYIFNEQARTICRCGRDEEPVGTFLESFHPGMWTQVRDVFFTGDASTGEKHEVGEVTIMGSASPVHDDDGDVCGVMCVFQDITALEKKLSIIRKLHHELQGVFESSQDGLFITDGRSRVIMLNTAYEQITGLCRTDLVGRTMEDLVKQGVYDQSATLKVLASKRPVSLLQVINRDKKVMVTGTPIRNEEGEIEFVVSNVRDMNALNVLRHRLEASRRKTRYYRDTIREHDEFEKLSEVIVFKSKAMNHVLSQVAKAARYDMPVLFSGESGVGKTLLAREIHRISVRRAQPFIKLNCGAIPESLMESELFGYEKGAFTGALARGKIGLFEAAHKGSLFLDEIAELTPAMQVKLLEVIEEGRFLRVGATEKTGVDVRIVAASNVDLQEAVAAGRFRSDLFYRLNVIPIRIPSLRDRRDDVPVLAQHFLAGLNKQHGMSRKMAPEVLDGLLRYAFPGNIRELENLIERMYVFCEEDTITSGDLPGELKQPCGDLQGLVRSGATLQEAMDEMEAGVLREALSMHESPEVAARTLGIHPTTLWRKVRKFNLQN